MILAAIINIFMFIVTTVINLVTGSMGQNTLENHIIDFIEFIMSFTSQALNFCHFILGDTIFFVLPIAIILLGLKYTIIPLIVIFRSFFINSNN